MAIKTIDLGGTNWADGDTLFSADLNDTYGAVTLHRKQFSDVTERSFTSSPSWADSGTAFTLTIPINSMIIGMKIEAELSNNSNGNNTDLNLKLSGSNLGTLYVVSRIMDEAPSTAPTIPLQIIALHTSEATLLVMDTGTSFVKRFGTGYIPLKILDASTTLTVRFQGTGNGSIKNVVVDVMYIEVFKED